MGFIGGIILLAVAVAMLVVGRGGRDGEPRAFLSNWLINTNLCRWRGGYPY
jgi:hypothetical protein